MEFWGVEVKSGQKFPVKLDEDKVLHLSQACLGEVKKDKSESVNLFVELDGKKLVLGTLFTDKLPQQLFDLVFDKDFELTHNWKHGSIYFYGYIADQPYDGPEEEFDEDSDSEDELIPLEQPAKPASNGKLEAKPKAEKANATKDSNAGKQKVKIVEPSKEDDSDDDSDDSDDAMSEDDEFDSEGDDSLEGDADSEDDEDSDDEEETPQKETPQKVQSGKKRPSESATKTPVPDKKAKLVTPQKTDGKKGGVHVATPHPSKQTGKKTPANKSNEKSPKSADGAHSCKSCKKNFNSEGALSSHNQAKHSAAK